MKRMNRMKKMKRRKDGRRILGQSALVVVTMSALLVASIPAFAAETSTKTVSIAVLDESKPDSADTEVFPDEITANTADTQVFLDETEDNSADTQLLQGEIEVDYGDLTDAEIKELEGIYDRYESIFRDIYGDDLLTEDESEISDAEMDARAEAGFKKYEKELEQLDQRAAELEKKAGWADEILCTETELDSVAIENLAELSEDDLATCEQLYKDADAIGLVSVITDENSTDEDLEKFMKEHEAEVKELDESARELEKKLLGEDES